MTQLQAPAGLYGEAVEVYQNLGDRPAAELLAGLNTPDRIQTRGYPVRADHLLAVVIDRWKSSDDTRYALYDFSEDELASARAYLPEEIGEAREDANELDNVQIVRFDQ